MYYLDEKCFSYSKFSTNLFKNGCDLVVDLIILKKHEDLSSVQLKLKSFNIYFLFSFLHTNDDFSNDVLRHIL